MMGRIDWTRNETLVALIIAGFCIVAALGDPGFLSMATLTDLLRGGIVMGIFAVARLLVLISGGIDVSFAAVAAFTMYATAMALNTLAPWVPWWGAFLAGMGIGASLGAINGILIAGLGLPTLIVTPGTLSVFRGFMLTFIGQKQITTLPPGMREFGRMMLLRGENADGSIYSLHAAFLVTVLSVVITWAILHRTMLGVRSLPSAGRSKARAASASTCAGCSSSSTPMSGCWPGWPGSSMPRWRGWPIRSIWSG